MTKSLTVTSSPIVTVKGGQAFADSRDVAAFFQKNHADLLRDTDKLISLGVSGFAETPYIHPQNGQTYRTFSMTKDGFVFLAMGFTGPAAARFKEAYIARFNELKNVRCALLVP